MATTDKKTTKGNIFRAVRVRLGENMYGMSLALGINQTQYSYCERKAKSTTFEMLKKLYKISGMSADEFMRAL